MAKRGKKYRAALDKIEDGRLYGAHWWVVGDELGTFWANGYEGQSILVCPALDLVVVRLGKSLKAQYPALAAPLGSAPVAQRARAYLETNCAQCHQPGGPTALDMDLRAVTPIPDTHTVGVAGVGPSVGGATLRKRRERALGRLRNTFRRLYGLD